MRVRARTEILTRTAPEAMRRGTSLAEELGQGDRLSRVVADDRDRAGFDLAFPTALVANHPEEVIPKVDVPDPVERDFPVGVEEPEPALVDPDHSAPAVHRDAPSVGEERENLYESAGGKGQASASLWPVRAHAIYRT